MKRFVNVLCLLTALATCVVTAASLPIVLGMALLAAVAFIAADWLCDAVSNLLENFLD